MSTCRLRHEREGHHRPAPKPGRINQRLTWPEPVRRFGREGHQERTIRRGRSFSCSLGHWRDNEGYS
jgi:hypothetical protein